MRIFTADWPHGGLGGQVPTSAQSFVWCWRAVECCDRLQCFSVSISDPGPSLSMCQSLRLSCCFRPFSLFSGVSREPFTAVASAGRQEMDCLWPLSLSLLYPDYPTCSDVSTFRCLNMWISQMCLCVELGFPLLNYSCPTCCNCTGRDLEVS